MLSGSIIQRLQADADGVTEAITTAVTDATGGADAVTSSAHPFLEFLNDGLWGEITKSTVSGNYETWQYIVYILMWLAIIIIPYILGSLNFALIASKLLYKDDIRNYGSGNAGLTNMYRVYGKKGAIFTLLGDSLKTVVAVALGYALLGNLGSFGAALFCVLGHIFPVFYKFQGGKGVLAAGISILMLDPPIFLILFTVFIVIVAGTKYVSLGSIMAMMMFPLVLSRLRGPGLPVIFAFLISACVIFMHRSNIVRLWNKKESKFSFKAKIKSADAANGPERDKDNNDDGNGNDR